MQYLKDSYKSAKRSFGIPSKKEKNGNTNFSIRGGEHGAAGGRSSPTESERSLDVSTHSRAGVRGALVFGDEQGVQAVPAFAQAAAPVSARRFEVRADPPLPIQINQAPTSARSAVAFTPRAPRPQLPPLDLDEMRREVERDAVRPDVQARVRSSPASVPMPAVDWAVTMQITSAGLQQHGMERKKVGSLCNDLSEEGEESALYVEMTKVQTFNFATMEIGDYSININTCPVHVLKVIALSINPQSQPKACEAVFASWQKCMMTIENNFSGAIKNIVTSKINNLVTINAGDSPFVVSDLYYDYTCSLLPNKTEAKIMDIQKWFDARLCKEVMNLVQNAFTMQKNAVSTVNKAQYAQYVRRTVAIVDPLAEEDDDDDE